MVQAMTLNYLKEGTRIKAFDDKHIVAKQQTRLQDTSDLIELKTTKI